MIPPADTLQIPTRFGKPATGLRRDLYSLLFESDTRTGMLFDLGLIGAVLLSILVVLLDSVHTIQARHGLALNVLEWTFTLLFTLEYAARLYSVEHRMRYVTSFFGIIDLLAILPTYVAFFVPEAHALLDVRILRLLRIFRVLKLTLYVAEYSTLMQALRASRRKVTIFIAFVLMLDLLLGTLMYVIEGPEYGFTSIPVAMYWAIVTMTTVGYGDLTPHTDAGRLLASVMMLLGWGILAVPTGIVTSEMAAQRMTRALGMRTCPACDRDGLEADAKYCQECGSALPAGGAS